MDLIMTAIKLMYPLISGSGIKSFPALLDHKFSRRCSYGIEPSCV